MILKQNFTAHEIQTKNELESISPLALFLLKRKAQGLLKGILVFDALIAELDSFAKRNSAPFLEKGMQTSCPDCVKAHALVKAREFGLDKRAIDFIGKILPGNVGHKGYYLDGDVLNKIE